ncbi:MAG TPA: hypothetical protein DEA43_00970 [Candidatus Moranbacteria bacterium]|nr:hypothetical protein [Candidatus Moranbacteria bacterium]HBT45441.1 hypothetical protein [Candidatus Moranbacteria bacterium]
MREKHITQESSKLQNSNLSGIKFENDQTYSKSISQELAEMRIQQEKKDIDEIDKIMGFFRVPERNNEVHVFDAGEKFDPYSEIDKIRVGSKKEKRHNLEIYKKKLIFQRKGITEMQTHLYELMQKKETMTVEMLKQSIADLEDKYALCDEQRRIFDSAIKIYAERHNGIVENTRDCIDEEGNIDGKKLYEKIFGRQPYGDVNVEILPITIYLRTFDFEDYAYVHSNAYKNKREIDDDEFKNASMSGGVKLWNSGFSGLESVVTLQNANNVVKRMFKSISDETRDHEDQHNFNDLIDEAFINNGSASSPIGENEEILRDVDEKEKKKQDAESRDIGIEMMIGDEMCAFFKTGNSAQYIHDAILKKDTIYEYGKNYRKEKRKHGEQFSQNYKDLVDGGIVAMFDLLDHGYSRKEVIALLFFDLPSQWGKVVSRVLERRKTTTEEKQDRKKIVNIIDRISRHITGKFSDIYDFFRVRL